MRTLVTVVAAALLTLTPPARLLAVGPAIMMFYGSPLKARVFLTGADAGTFNNLLSPTDTPLTAVEGRSYVSVACFWGSATPASYGVAKLEDLQPDMAWQHGRLFAATKTQPAVLLTTSFTKAPTHVPVPTEMAAFRWGGAVSPESLAVLKRIGIPTGPPK